LFRCILKRITFHNRNCRLQLTRISKLSLNKLKVDYRGLDSLQPPLYDLSEFTSTYSPQEPWHWDSLFVLLARARAHTHTRTHTRARTHTHAHTHTRAHTHAHARAHTRTHTHTQIVVPFTIAKSRCYCLSVFEEIAHRTGRECYKTVDCHLDQELLVTKGNDFWIRLLMYFCLAILLSPLSQPQNKEIKNNILNTCSEKDLMDYNINSTRGPLCLALLIWRSNAQSCRTKYHSIDFSQVKFPKLTVSNIICLL